VSMAGVIKVHGHHGSTATATVLCCLNEKKVEYELVFIDFFEGDQKKPQHLALNPFGQIPVIQDGDFTLFESRAIAKYLAKKYMGQGTDLLGSTLTEQALVEQWCEVEGQSFRGPAFSIIEQILLAPILGDSTDEEAVKISVEKVGKVLDVYEERLSKSKYLAGDFFSLADLQHLPYTHYLVNACGKGDLISSRKHVKAWWEDISSRPAWKKVAEKMKFK